MESERAATLQERSWWLNALYVVAAALSVGPVLAVDIPPLYDLPSHLARLAVLLDGGASPQLDAMFDIHWSVLPNLALELVALPLASIMSVESAARTFLVLALILQVSGAVALSRAVHGRFTALPLLAVFFVYNGVLNYGFVAYVFSVGLALHLLAFWIRLRPRRASLRAALFLPALTLLFFCHLYAFGLFGLCAGLYELGHVVIARRQGRNRRDATAEAARNLTLLAAAALPALLLLMLSPTGGALSTTSWEDLASVSFYLSKPKLLLAALEGGLSWADRLLIVALGAGVAAGLAGGVLELSAPLLPPLAGLSLAFLLMPETVSSSWGANLRVPLAACLVLAGALTWGRRATPSRRAAAIGVLSLVCVLRIASVLGYWIPTGRELVTIREALGRLPKGSHLTVVVALDQAWRRWTDPPYLHMGSYALLDREAFFPAIFAYPGQQPIERTAPFEAKAKASGRFNWFVEEIARAAPGSIPPPAALSEFDYVLVARPSWFGDRLSPRLEPIAEGSTFAVMRVLKYTAKPGSSGS